MSVEVSVVPAAIWERQVWHFHNPVRLQVGRGCRQALLASLPERLLVVTTQRGRRQLAADGVLGALAHNPQVLWVDSVTENPGLAYLQAEIDRLKPCRFDAVLAFGGGSAMDASKVLNVALSPTCQPHSLEALLRDAALHAGAQPRPLFAVPTTAGTGSEVTPFATVWDHQQKKKLSLAGPAMFPTSAWVDAALTDSVPLEVTVSTGLDAINQAAESIWNKNANPITLGYACRALQLGLSALPQLAKGEGGTLAREQMAEASLLAGLAISHTRTALCHSISYPLTAHFGVPHGLACAFTMPAVLRHNLLAEDGRFAWVAQVLTGSAQSSALLECFESLHQALGVRERVRAYLPDLPALLTLQNQMLTPGRAGNNLHTVESLEPILRQSWQGGSEISR